MTVKNKSEKERRLVKKREERKGLGLGGLA